MSYPTKYTRQYDYVSYQNANPNRPLPAGQLHADFSQIALSTNEIVEFLKTSIRADGALANKSVSRDQLTNDVLNGVGDTTALNETMAEAQDYAIAAANSAVDSSTFASASATSATAAAGSATAAAGSATAAANSATSSSTYASNSASSASAAAASASVVAGNLYAFDSSTTMAAPSAGGVRFNNATVALVTALAFSAQSGDVGNPNISAFLATWGASNNGTSRGTITIRKIGSPATFATFTVTAAVTNNTTWLQLSVAYVAGNGTFSAADALSVQFTRTGEAGTGLLPVNNLSDVSSVPTAVRNLAPTDLNLSGTPGGSSPRIKSYTDSSRVVFGKEYLSAWYNAWRTGGGLSRPIIMRGDSTMVGNSLSQPTYTSPDILFASIAIGKGVRISTPTNLGVGGTTTADWLNTHLPSDLATYTGTNIPRLYILNYGMNDPYVGPISQSQTITNLRAGFALLRGTWDANKTSVVYMMPNTAYDDTNSRNETWRETIVAQIKQACRDYGVMFFDTYAALREARYGLITGWLNATDKVHPADDFNLAIWGEFVDALIPSGVIDAATRPQKVTPATGFALPGAAEDMNTCAVGRMGLGAGYITMNTPGTIAAGTTLATIHAYHVPLTQAWAVQMAAFSGSWQFFQGIITTGGVITNQQAISITTQRVYFGPGHWQR
ncbi:SGNH/GDSL hydrolase family protein [Bradyrhizobium barranii subsp. apii]|uniref:SGNH/GDSL hydrolase family protein n=1 Tax=Bradyrhizobium barranii subsp. apii TaxID=2819348 RepID=A0A8T5VJT8_9BRAD|nr:SGNH/GDSL hydrolase family protein [Bradyrhizobium barranii]UPT83856.1 SGNH/GDSL hydrolase family protein [Bradyrhizobium barranii subsp. apii]